MQPVDDVRQASRTLVRTLGFLDDGRSRWGVTHRQIHLLIELNRHRVLGVGASAGLLQVDKSTTSRALGDLERRGFVRRSPSAGDARRSEFSSSKKGERLLDRVDVSANQTVEEALSLLREEDRDVVARGLALYARSLERAARRRALTVRRIQKADDAQIAAVIRKVMPEFGATGAGFAIEDPEVDGMTAAYRGRRARYYVILEGDRVLGGAGFAHLEGADEDVCELRKMYFLREVRGLGLGKDLLERLIREAAQAGFRTMYLETLTHMHAAQRLYRSLGFQPLDGPMGATGHFGCDKHFARALP